MPFARRWAWVLAAGMTIAAPTNGWAQGPGGAPMHPGYEDAVPLPRPKAAGKTLTGKERLSGKASDDQRLDNCKVPPEKRGPKPRPDSCDHDERGMP